MKRTALTLLATALIALLLQLLGPIHADAQISAVPPLMNFQGRLAKPDGTPVPDGSYSIRFSLHDALSGGTEKWNQTVNPVVVRNGTFVVLLSGFAAGTFNTNLWLEIKIGTDAPLTPRQQLVSVAYAMKADSVKDNAITSASIANGTISAADLAPDALNTLSWLLNGNSGVTSGFLGTTDDQPLELRVNNRRVMRYQYGEFIDAIFPELSFRTMNVLGGADINSIAEGALGATIAGGGQDYLDDSQADLPNRVLGSFGTVGGGEGNTAGGGSTVGGGHFNTASNGGATIGGGSVNSAIGELSTVGGGIGNIIAAGGYFATVGGGAGNIITENGHQATIGGGRENTAGGDRATVGGGFGNTASLDFATVGGGFNNVAGGVDTTVGGGQNNTASGGAATVAGGSSNTASGGAATVGGGQNNTASGVIATVGGGESNTATDDYAAVAGGRNNRAIRDYAAVGGGSGNTASGNYSTVGGGFGNTASGDRATVGGGGLNTALGAYSFAAGRRAKANHAGTLVWADNTDADFASTAVNQFLVRAGGGVGINTNNPAGFALNVAGNIQCVSLTQTSDERYKRNVATFDNALDAILNLRGVTFDWKQDAYPDRNFGAGRQIGFLAQEVEKVLPELVSTDKQGYKSVAYQNVVPVLVEAVKTLNGKVEAQQKQIETLKAQLAALLAASQTEQRR